MSDLKSKLPDLGELGSMAGKLFKDVKNSVCEIVDTYKAKHKETKASAPKAAKTEAPKAETPKVEEEHKKEDE